MVESQIAIVLLLEQENPEAPKVLKAIRLEIPGFEILELRGEGVSDLSFITKVITSEVMDRGTGTGVTLAGLDYTQAGSQA